MFHIAWDAAVNYGSPVLLITNAYDALKQARALDEAVGIAVTHLTDGDDMSFYITEIAPGEAIRPHYHRQGAEVYFIIRGDGLLRTWMLPRSKERAQCVTDGAVIKIAPNTVHRLENFGTRPLVLFFACRQEHLSSDRVLIEVPEDEEATHGAGS